MARITLAQQIEAPVELVFKTISEIEYFSKAVPEIVSYEILSETKAGLSTRFRETRVTNGKEMHTELEITEFIDNEHVRMVADSHGTIWDTLFTFQESQGQTLVTVVMDAKAHKLLPKLLNPLLKGLYKKGIKKNMEDVNSYLIKNKNS